MEDAHGKELRRLRNHHEVELRQRDLQAARDAFEKAKLVEENAQQVLENAKLVEENMLLAEENARLVEEIDKLNHLLEVNHIEDRVAVRNFFYGRENTSSSAEQVNEGESVLPLNVRFQKVADKLMEFSRSSGIPEVPSGSRQLSENPFVENPFIEKYLHVLNKGEWDDLMQLEEIRETRAAYVLEVRKESSEPFQSLDDLEKIGLPKKRIKNLKGKLWAKHGEQFV